MLSNQTFVDLLTLCAGGASIGSNIGGVAHLLLARELSGRLLSSTIDDPNHFALRDARLGDQFDVIRDLARINLPLSAGAVRPELPHGGAIVANRYLHRRQALIWQAASPRDGEMPIPVAYLDPQLGIDAAVVVTAGAAAISSLSTLRTGFQSAVDLMVFAGIPPEAYVQVRGTVTSGAFAPLVIWKTVPAEVNYTLSGPGTALIPDNVGNHTVRAWGSVYSSSTSNPMPMTLALFVDGVAAATVNATRNSSDPSVPTGWEVFLLNVDVEASIQVKNTTGSTVTIEGAIEAKGPGDGL